MKHLIALCTIATFLVACNSENSATLEQTDSVVVVDTVKVDTVKVDTAIVDTTVVDTLK